MTAEEAELFAQTDSFVKAFEDAMDDDFNTADAVAAIFELVRYSNTNADAKKTKEYLGKIKDLIVKLADVLGLIVEKKEEILAEDIEKLIEERQAARKADVYKRQKLDDLARYLYEKETITGEEFMNILNA